VKYFAYGSNMDLDQMKRRCPDAEFLGPAVLPGCSFHINRRGVATVISSTGKVHGILWEISSEDGRKLSRHEGEALGLYLKASVWVEPRNLGRTEGMIHLATDLRPGKPRDGYFERILKAATDHHFPGDYIASLASWQNLHPATPELPS
jgi:AIG2-like family